MSMYIVYIVYIVRYSLLGAKVVGETRENLGVPPIDK
jgi:hypothetical protein